MLPSVITATTTWRVWGATDEKFQNDFLSIYENFSFFSSHVTVRTPCCLICTVVIIHVWNIMLHFRAILNIHEVRL